MGDKVANRGRRQIVLIWLHVRSPFEASACGLGQIVACTNMVSGDLVSEVMRMRVAVIPTIRTPLVLLPKPLIIDHVCVAGAPSEEKNYQHQAHSDENITHDFL
jgi:hypothetical protein